MTMASAAAETANVCATAKRQRLGICRRERVDVTASVQATEIFICRRSRIGAREHAVISICAKIFICTSVTVGENVHVFICIAVGENVIVLIRRHIVRMFVNFIVWKTAIFIVRLTTIVGKLMVATVFIEVVVATLRLEPTPLELLRM